MHIQIKMKRHNPEYANRNSIHLFYGCGEENPRVSKNHKGSISSRDDGSWGEPDLEECLLRKE